MVSTQISNQILQFLYDKSQYTKKHVTGEEILNSSGISEFELKNALQILEDNGFINVIRPSAYSQMAKITSEGRKYIIGKNEFSKSENITTINAKNVQFINGSNLGDINLIETNAANLKNKSTDQPNNNLIRVLLLSVNDPTKDNLNLSKEIKSIKEGLIFNGGNHFQVFDTENATKSDFVKGLKWKPDIIHYSGHGEDNGAIFLYNEIGIVNSIEPGKLAELFSVLQNEINIRCIVLNACYSEKLAEKLSPYADVVLGTTGPIKDFDAVQFAFQFYKNIADTMDLKKSFKLAIFASNNNDLDKIIKWKSHRGIDLNLNSPTEVDLPEPPTGAHRVAYHIGAHPAPPNQLPVTIKTKFKLCKNVDNLTHDELEALCLALSKMMELKDEKGYAHYARMDGTLGYHGPAYVDGHPSVRLFLPWHRAYLYNFEKVLQEIDENVKMPYWDWTTKSNQISSAFSDEFIFGKPNPFYKFHINLPNLSINRDTIRFPGSSIGENFQLELPGANSISKLMSLTNFIEFSDTLENFHNMVHMWVGGQMIKDGRTLVGDMCNLRFSSFDPIFWPMSTMIDKIWWMWQKRNEINKIPQSYNEMVLNPFKMKVKDVLDIHNLGYDYA